MRCLPPGARDSGRVGGSGGALAAKARQGNAQAARELREWLRTYAPPKDADLEVVAFEDMTPDQRAFARLYFRTYPGRA